MDLTTYLIICPLIFLAGFIDAIAGGGGLVSLPAYLATGIPTHVAMGTSKLSSALGTFSSTWGFIRAGYLQLKLSLVTVITAIVGALIGSLVAVNLSDYFFKIILLIIIPATALYILFRKNALNIKVQSSSVITSKQFKLALLISFIIGVYDGFYGPGSGTFLVILLTGISKLPLNLSLGTTKVINLATNSTGLLIFLLNGKVLIILGLIAGVCSILGNYYGVIYYQKYGGKIARPIIIIVLVLAFSKILFDFITTNS